jgi:hypothetical protein
MANRPHPLLGILILALLLVRCPGWVLAGGVYFLILGIGRYSSSSGSKFPRGFRIFTSEIRSYWPFLVCDLAAVWYWLVVLPILPPALREDCRAALQVAKTIALLGFVRIFLGCVWWTVSARREQRRRGLPTGGPWFLLPPKPEDPPGVVRTWGPRQFPRFWKTGYMPIPRPPDQGTDDTSAD